MFVLLKIFFCYFSIISLAGSIKENFSTLERFSSENSTAVWNLSKVQVHLPLAVTPPSRLDPPNLDDGKIFTSGRDIVPSSGNFSIGTGKDGNFDSSTYCDFDINNCSTPSLITLDTTKEYEFINFTLEENYTLTGMGAKPLIIRVQGDVLIKGSIDISGKDGENISSDTNVTPRGGESCCGGGKGGDGGSRLAASKAGESPVSNGMGGGGGISDSGGGGGGGGGANSDGAQAGFAVSPTSAGSKGIEYWDNSVKDLYAGSGGGGGGAHVAGGSEENGSGGGGGGGGGALFMAVGGNLTIEASGSIYANGGNGGGTTSSTILSGGGGGGSGGSIVLFSGETFYNCSEILARYGEGGKTPGDLRNGGKGAKGGIRIVDRNDWANSTPCGGKEVEDPLATYSDFGKVIYSTSSYYYIESETIDTRNSSPTNFSVDLESTVPSNTSLDVELKGSSDNFKNDDTDWVSSKSFSLLDGKRYIKFRLILSSNNENSSPIINSLTINFTEKNQPTFNFTFAACASVKTSNKNSPIGFILWLLIIILGVKTYKVYKA